MHEGWRIGQNSEGGEFCPGKLVWMAAKVSPGCRTNPNHISTKRSMPGIELENFFFGIPAFQTEGLHEFQHFPAQISFPFSMRQAHHLHTDGTGSTQHFHCPGILDYSSSQCKKIHTRMMVKPLIFKQNESLLVTWRKAIPKRKPPLSVLRNPGLKQFAVAIGEYH